VNTKGTIFLQDTFCGSVDRNQNLQNISWKKEYLEVDLDI